MHVKSLSQGLNVEFIPGLSDPKAKCLPLDHNAISAIRRYTVITETLSMRFQPARGPFR